MIKKVLVLFLIFVLCSNSFAAIVSDNDGSAFVTKAEFDALKTNFAKQIDDYNTSIDSKIDGAIASYLAGIQLSTRPTNLWEKVVYFTNGKIRWCNDTSLPTGSSTVTNDVSVNALRYYHRKEVKVYTAMRAHFDKGADPMGHPGLIYQVGATQADADSVSSNMLMRAYFLTPGTYMLSQGSWTDKWWSGYVSFTNVSPDPVNTYNYQQKVTNGSGYLWEFNELPSGKFELKKYNSTAFVSNTVDVTSIGSKKTYSETSAWNYGTQKLGW